MCTKIGNTATDFQFYHHVWICIGKSGENGIKCYLLSQRMSHSSLIEFKIDILKCMFYRLEEHFEREIGLS